MTSLIKKSLYELIRAIKPPLKFGLMGVFVLLGITLLTSEVLGATFLEEDFENYNTGSLLGQGDWVNIAGDNWYVTTDDALSGSKSIKNYTSTEGSGYHKDGDETEIGRITFYSKQTDVSTWVNTALIEIKGYYETSLRTFIEFSYYANGIVKYQTSGSGGYQTIGTMEVDTWYPIETEWDSTTHLARVRFNEGDWTDWKSIYWGIPSRFQFRNYPVASGTNKFWLDFISENLYVPECDFEHCNLCDNWFDCQVVGCCWYYNPYLTPTNYCGDCYEECSIETCGSCDNQEDCEAVGCYWTGEYCSWVVSECGGGLACQFCDNQEDCEAEGCYWSSVTETCWYKASTLPSSWEDYYDLHGGYEEPAEFVNDLAETTGKTFDTISSLFEGFITSFSNSDALARGTSLGEVIPKSRGYLKIFDSLFGHIPIGELFVFILVFMLAIGLFRIARHLIQMVKP
jgi:hypothetical protein